MVFGILDELAITYGGSKANLAKAIGITPSAFSRLANTPPSVEVCLRLAHVTGENPSKILRAAGRGDIADLLETLYGHAGHRRARRGPRTSPKEQTLIEALRRVDAGTRRALDVVIGMVVDTVKPRPDGRPAAKPRRRIRSPKAA